MKRRCIAALAGVFLAGIFLAGCATASIEDAVPEGALATAGTYPNVAVEPPAAAAQISEEQKTAETSDLRAKRDALAQRSGAAEADVSRELSDLGASHGEAVLKEIEGR